MVAIHDTMQGLPPLQPRPDKKDGHRAGFGASWSVWGWRCRRKGLLLPLASADHARPAWPCDRAACIGCRRSFLDHRAPCIGERSSFIGERALCIGERGVLTGARASFIVPQGRGGDCFWGKSVVALKQGLSRVGAPIDNLPGHAIRCRTRATPCHRSSRPPACFSRLARL